MSLANQVLDHLDDVSKNIWADLNIASAPSAVRQSPVSEASDLLKVGADAYALSTRLPDGATLSKYPVHTKADAWLSAQYFEKTAHKLPEGLRKEAKKSIDSALKRHGLEDVFVKKASEESKHFALGKKYPIDSAAQVKLACAYFEEWKESLPLEARREYATKVASRARELGTEHAMGPSLRKYAGEGYGTEVCLQLKLRQEIVAQTDALVESLSKIAKAKNELPADKFAVLLAAFDKEAGLSKYHGKYLADPYAATFEEKEHRKIASGYSWEDESTGLKLSESDLKKVAEDKAEKLKSFLGESVVKELKKHGASIFESLPVDAKIVVAKIAKGLI